MDDNQKLIDAQRILEKIRGMHPEELHAHIEKVAGEPLAAWMLEYAITIMKADPARIVENGAALMLMGYLIRDAEVRPGQEFPRPQKSMQPRAKA
jgi:hypothetical protein